MRGREREREREREIEREQGKGGYEQNGRKGVSPYYGDDPSLAMWTYFPEGIVFTLPVPDERCHVIAGKTHQAKTEEKGNF